MKSIEEKREYLRQWREKNRLKDRANKEIWKAMNPEKVRMSSKKQAKKRKEYLKQYYAEHRERIREKHKAHYYANHAYWRAKARGYRHTANLKRYGLTPAQYDERFASQQGLCAICHHPERLRKGKPVRLAVDHDHGTGAVRGLLCRRCNLGIGGFEHNSHLLARAIEYLSRTGG